MRKTSKNHFYFGASLLLAVSSCTHEFTPMEQIKSLPIHGESQARANFNLNATTSYNKLRELVALNNAELKAAYLRWQTEILKVYPAGTLPDPHLSFTHYIQEVETRVGPQEQAVTVMQKFPWFGKLDLRKAMQTEQAKVAQASYEALKLKLFRELEELYYDFYFQQESLKIAKANKALLINFEPIARNLIKTGKGAKDLLKLQVELGRIEDRISSIDLGLAPLKARLNELLNRRAGEPVSLTAVLPARLSVTNESSLQQLLKKNNPSLKKLDAMLSVAENKILLARKDFSPDLDLGLKYIQTSGAARSVDDNGKDPIMLTLAMNLPLNHRKYRHLEKVRIQEFTAIRAKREGLERSLERRLKVALYELEDNERIIKLYENTLIPKNTQALKITLQAYHNGKASFLELIDIQRQVLAFQLMQEKALTQIYKQEAVLRELSNTNFTGVK